MKLSVSAAGFGHNRERRLVFQHTPGPEQFGSQESLPPMERGNIQQYFLHMLTAVSRLFNSSSFHSMYGQWGQTGMQNHLDTFMASQGYPAMGPMPGMYPGRYPTRRGRFPGTPRIRTPRTGSGTPERLPSSGVLHSIEIRDETPRFGVRITTGSTNTDIIINTADLSVTPPNGNDLLRTNGIRVVYFPVGGRNAFRVEFTRPGNYGVGRLTGATMNWSVITLASSPRPGTGTPEVSPLPDVVPVADTPPAGVTFETLPNGLRRPKFEGASSTWRNNVVNVAETLNTPSNIEAVLTIRPPLREELRRYLGTHDGITFSQNATAPAGQEFSFTMPGGQKWFVTERAIIARERARPFNPSDCVLVLRNETDELMQRPVDLRTVFPSGTAFSVEQLRTAIREASERRRNEASDPARVASFDLPRDRQVGYVGICDTDGLDMQHISHFPAILNGHGYNVVTTGRWATAINRENPIGVIRGQVALMHGKGVKDFVIDMYPHGTSSYMSFSNGQRIHPADIRALVNAFPDSKFLIRTNSCYAGGLEGMNLQDAFSGDDDLSRRLTIVYQTTNRTPNRVSRASGEGSYISAYDAILIQYMKDNPGCTLGAAMRHADLQVKRITPGADAGVIRSGRTGDVRTVLRDENDRRRDRRDIRDDDRSPPEGMA